MTLKKRTKEPPSISWDTCLSFGVEDTAYNKQRHKAGFTLDLIADAKEALREPQDTKEAAEIDASFLDDQDRLHCNWCNNSYLTLSNLNKHMKSKHPTEETL